MDNWMTEFPVNFVSAAGVVFKEDKVLLIRSDRRGWEFPGGIVENGKAVLDALNGVVWKDDKQVVGLLVFKAYGEEDKINIENRKNAEEAKNKHDNRSCYLIVY